MTTHEGKKKKRRTVLEGFNNVPDLLEKARQAVDEVTQMAQPPRREAKPAKRKEPKAAPPRKSAEATGQQKEPSLPAVPPTETVTKAATAAPDTRRELLRDLAYYGITVKHAIPGRIRLRLRKLLHNEPLAEKLQLFLATVPGVTFAEASAATGSLLILFNSQELAAATSRENLAGVVQQFFPGLDTEALVKRMLRA